MTPEPADRSKVCAFYLRESTHRRFKTFCANNGASMSEVLDSLLTAELDALEGASLDTEVDSGSRET